MKNKFLITYASWLISLILYMYISFRASVTQEQFFYLLTIGTMVSMLFFCFTLMLFTDNVN